jgi:hypothetical protein
MLQPWIEHLRNCASVRRLLRQHDSHNLQNLYWYDMRLVDAVRWRGIARVLWWNLTGRKQDEIAGNYGQKNLYWAPPPVSAEESRRLSNATVWRCATLDSRPWHDGPNPVRRALEAHAEEIQAEFRVIAERIATHPDNTSLTDRGRWTGLFLYGAGGVRNEELAQSFPRTMSVLESLPLCRNFGFAMFSGMDPHTHVAAHSGSSNLRLRHHLGLTVPEPGKSRLRVGEEWREWRQGETFAFDDSFEHEVLHEGDLARVVLVVDVWHPGLGPNDIAVLENPVFQRFGKVSKVSRSEEPPPQRIEAPPAQAEPVVTLQPQAGPARNVATPSKGAPSRS